MILSIFSFMIIYCLKYQNNNINPKDKLELRKHFMSTHIMLRVRHDMSHAASLLPSGIVRHPHTFYR